MAMSFQKICLKNILILLILWSDVYHNTDGDACTPCSCRCKRSSVPKPCVDCINRGLTTIPRLPSYITNTVRTLILRDNRITTIEDGMFKGYADLKWLYLEHNGITNISKDAFTGLETLERLYLRGNRIQTLARNIFCKLKMLECLDLRANSISKISEDSFSGIGRLKKLDLKRNRIQILVNSTFTQLQGLEILDLSSNVISDICEDSFRGLNRLLKLFLGGNRIELLKSNVFRQLGMLEQLSLYRNSISDISRVSFTGLGRLQRLALFSNKIRTLRTDSFRDLTSLKQLILQRNKISSIRPETFLPLVNLNKLYLHDNKLRNIPEALWLVHRPDLELRLQNNPFQCSCILLNEVKQVEFKVKTLLPTLSFFVDQCRNITSVCEDERDFALGMKAHHTCLTHDLYSGYSNTDRRTARLAECPSSMCWEYLRIDLPSVIVVTQIMVNMKLLELYESNQTTIMTVKVGDKRNDTYTQCSTFVLTPNISTVNSSCMLTPYGRNVLIEISKQDHIPVVPKHCVASIKESVSIGKNQLIIRGYEKDKYNIWSIWNAGPCSKPCGYGRRKRNRTCTKPTSAKCLISRIQHERSVEHHEEQTCIIKPCSKAVYYWSIGGVIGVLVLVIFGITFWYRKFKMIVYFEGLRPNPNFQLDPNRTLMEQIEELPYDLHWEFPRNDVRFGSVIGEGNFGRVWHAKAKGIKAFKPRERTDLSSRAKLAKLQDQRVHAYFTTITEAWILGDCDSTHHYDVAVKTLKECATPKHKMDLASELKLLIYMDQHPNIVNLLASCTIRGDLWMIMEYCHYGSLKKFLSDRQNRFNPCWSKEVLDISTCFCLFDLHNMSEQIMKGIMFLHCWKVVHRDLSARNILIDANFNLKVTDFGLARSENFVASADDIIPIKWSSPESLLRHEYTSKSDIWSVGILLWEIYSLGEMPYPGMSSKEVIQKLDHGYRMNRPDNCPVEIWSIIYECWNTDPQKRPTAAELFDQLNKIKISMCSPPEGKYYGFGGEYREAGTVQGPLLSEISKTQEELEDEPKNSDIIQNSPLSTVGCEQHCEIEIEKMKLQEKVDQIEHVIDTLSIHDNIMVRIDEIKMILNNATDGKTELSTIAECERTNNMEMVESTRKVYDKEETDDTNLCALTILHSKDPSITFEESNL